MTVEETVRKIWEEERPSGRTAFFRAILSLLAIPYRASVAARNVLYAGNLLQQKHLPCRVISVGNLTVGGTGKTPLVILLANILKERGHRPAVLSRGYGGRSRAPVNVVTDGTQILMGWREVGDEPVLIAQSTRGVPVLTGPRRLVTGRAALEKFGADCLILDDAFQHRALYRDLDILLLDAGRPFGNGCLLPRGPLRESRDAVNRARLIIRTGDGVEAQDIRDHGLTPIPTFRGHHRPELLVEWRSGRPLPLSAIRGQKVCAFAGIGHPDSFRRSLIALGAEVAPFFAFPDHHPYSPSDVDRIQRLATQSGATQIITTEKDGVRLAELPALLPNPLLLRIGMEINPVEPFTELIFSSLAY